MFVHAQNLVALDSNEPRYNSRRGSARRCAPSLDPPLCEVAERHNNVTILAYLDDIYAVGPNQSLQNVLDDLKSSLSLVGLEICDRKCELYCPSGNICDIPIPVTHDGMIILGTPVGNRDLFVLSVLI